MFFLKLWFCKQRLKLVGRREMAQAWNTFMAVRTLTHVSWYLSVIDAISTCLQSRPSLRNLYFQPHRNHEQNELSWSTTPNILPWAKSSHHLVTKLMRCEGNRTFSNNAELEIWAHPIHESFPLVKDWRFPGLGWDIGHSCNYGIISVLRPNAKSFTGRRPQPLNWKLVVDLK